MTKMFRFLVLPLLLMAMAAPAWADDISIIFDPSPPLVGTFYLIQTPGLNYEVSWGSCTQNGVPAALQGDQGCMLFLNETGAPITELTLTFMVNSFLAGQTIACSSTDGSLTGDTCAAAGTLVLNTMATVELYTSVPNYSAFFIAENGVVSSDLPPLDAQVPTYDPSTLVLLLAGMAMLGVCGVRRYA